MDEPRDDRDDVPGARRSGRVHIEGAGPAQEDQGGPPRLEEELPWPRPEDSWDSDPELPHWTEAPTGEVPAVLSRDTGEHPAVSADPWSAVPPPTWREEHIDWENQEGSFSHSMLADETPMGALDDANSVDQPWRFDLPEGRDAPYVEDEPTATIPAVGRDPVPPLDATGIYDDATVEAGYGGAEPFAEEPYGSAPPDATAYETAYEETPPAPGASSGIYDDAVAEAGYGGAEPFAEEPYGSAPPDAAAYETAYEEAPSAPGAASGIYDDAVAAKGASASAAPLESGAIYDYAAEPEELSEQAVPEVLATPGSLGPTVTGPDPVELDLAGYEVVAEELAAEELAEARSHGGQDLIDADEMLGRPPPRSGRGDRRRSRGPTSRSRHVAEAPAASAARPRSGPRPDQPRAARHPAKGRPEREASGREGGRSGRNLPVAIATGLGVAIVTLIAFALGTVASVLWVTVLVTVAAAEGLAAFRHAGYRPATVLGLVAVAGVMIGTYNKGEQAVPLVAILLVVFGLLWYVTGVERAEPVRNTAVTVFVFAWVGIFGSYAALLLNPSLFPDRHGIAFLLGAIIAAVAYDVGALAVGAWMGNRPLAPAISPNKTWEGLIGGSVAAIVVSMAVVQAIHPWTVGKALALGVVVAVVAPLGDLCESLVKRSLSLKDMGRLLPGHGGLLDRFDSLLFVLPATYYLVKALHLG